MFRFSLTTVSDLISTVHFQRIEFRVFRAMPDHDAPLQDRQIADEDDDRALAFDLSANKNEPNEPEDHTTRCFGRGISCRTKDKDSRAIQDAYYRDEPEFKASSPTQKPPSRNVYIYVQFYSVSNVDSVLQTFDAHFYFRATWVQNAKKKSSNSQPNQPSLIFYNAVEEPVLTEEVVGPSTWRTAELKNQQVYEKKARVRGRFRVQFDLAYFPYDTQLLVVMFTTGSRGVHLFEDVHDGTRSVFREEFVKYNPNFEFEPKVIVAMKRYWKSEQTNDDDKRPFERLDLGVVAIRRSHFFGYSIFLPCVFVSLAQFLVFAIPRSNFYQRIVYTLTLILFLTPAKWMVSDQLPRLYQASLCDIFILSSFSFLIAGLAVVATSTIKHSDKKVRADMQFERRSRSILLGIWIFIYAPLMMGTLIAWYYRKKKSDNLVKMSKKAKRAVSCHL